MYSFIAFAISIIYRDVHFILKEILEVGRSIFRFGIWNFRF